jgi:ubiquinone/menaquinone biosynthesis C-methylase UbiE
MPNATKPYGSTPSTARHFAGVARHYRALRDLDERSARWVGQILAALARPGAQVRTLDVGAGTGRYTEAVIAEAEADHGLRCNAVAYDGNWRMLVSSADAAGETEAKLARVVGLAETLPFRDEAFDAVLSFNAVHHFDLNAFLVAAARVLRREGLLIVYTRSPEQNQRTVWGHLFPHFAERETRLFVEEELRRALASRTEFYSVTLEPVPWTMRTTAARLVEQATRRYYSTFSFYPPKEFRAALATFKARLAEAYPDPTSVVSQNDHLLLIARRH